MSADFSKLIWWRLERPVKVRFRFETLHTQTVVTDKTPAFRRSCFNPKKRSVVSRPDCQALSLFSEVLISPTPSELDNLHRSFWSDEKRRGGPIASRTALALVHSEDGFSIRGKGCIGGGVRGCSHNLDCSRCNR